MMKKFWNWIKDDTDGRVLRLEGPIDEENFWGDEITPAMFREELEAEDGDVTVWINSPGGNVFAAAQIYTMIRDHPGRVTVKIDAIAASAASVVAMAGDRVLMSPVAMLMLHDPSTIAMGNAKDMEKAISTLNEVKESIINAYAAKSGLRRNKIAELMSNETWMNAKKAVELGFADEILFEEKAKEYAEEEEADEAENGSESKEGTQKENHSVTVLQSGQLYSTRLMGQAILDRLMGTPQESNPEEVQEELAQDGIKASADIEDNISALPVIGMDGRTADGSVPFAILEKQLEFLK